MIAISKVIRRIQLLKVVPRNFLLHLQSMNQVRNSEEKTFKVLIVIHAHWAEELTYIINRLNSLKIDVDLILTTTINEYKEKLEKLDKLVSNHNLKIYIVENIGRDVLPFLQVISGNELSVYSLVIKLHTKRSQKIWFRTLVNFHLKSTNRVKKQVRIAINNPLCVIGHPLLSYPISAMNQHYLKKEVEKFLGPLDAQGMRRATFIAGTMFSFHPSYLENIAKKLNSIRDTDFPVEMNYHQYTMAHVLERVFGVNAFTQGSRIQSIYLRDFFNLRAVFIRIS